MKTEMGVTVYSSDCSITLQRPFDRQSERVKQWQMDFNIVKSEVINFRPKETKRSEYSFLSSERLGTLRFGTLEKVRNFKCEILWFDVFRALKCKPHKCYPLHRGG